MAAREARRGQARSGAVRRRAAAPEVAVGRAAREPTFRALDREECEAVLARNAVGRLAFSFHDRVDIEPMHYVYQRAWLYGRTSVGSKLSALEHRRWVAFEVDEVDGVFDWRSVVVHGGFYVLAPDGAPREARAWEQAVELLRALVPETWSADDPVPFRTVVFRIHLDEVTGRAASTGASARAARAGAEESAFSSPPPTLSPEADR